MDNQLQLKPKQTELTLLRSNAQDYCKNICPKEISDCFDEQYNNLPALCKEIGKPVIKALMMDEIMKFIIFKGQKPFDDYILDMLIEQIIEECWTLNLADVKMCLKMHLGDKVYGSLSAGDILGMFQEYKGKRFDVADEMSYNEHLQNKAEKSLPININIQGLTDKFRI